MSEIDDLFVIDAEPLEDDIDISNSIPIPLFTSSRFTLGLLEDEKEEDEYFGKKFNKKLK